MAIIYSQRNIYIYIRTNRKKRGEKVSKIRSYQIGRGKKEKEKDVYIHTDSDGVNFSFNLDGRSLAFVDVNGLFGFSLRNNDILVIHLPFLYMKIHINIYINIYT